MSTPGYSGKPLGEKLGLKPGLVAFSVAAPDGYSEWLQCAPPPAWHGQHADILHVFLNSFSELESGVHRWRAAIFPKGMVWFSWPKKSSGIKTDIDEGKIRDFILTVGLVDVKVCAISDVWSGLKCVVPVAQRGS